MSKEEILQNHHSVMLTFGISLPEEDIDLPKLYWIPKLHKNPYKQGYIAGSAKCSTKPLSQILTRILTAVKEGLQKSCDTVYARSGVNQMWILKNSKELLENLKAQSLLSVNSIKSFDFSTLYTTIPHDKFKSKLKALSTSVSSTRMVTVDFSMLSLATKTHTSFGITLMRHKSTQMQM